MFFFSEMVRKYFLKILQRGPFWLQIYFRFCFVNSFSLSCQSHFFSCLLTVIMGHFSLSLKLPRDCTIVMICYICLWCILIGLLSYIFLEIVKTEKMAHSADINCINLYISTNLSLFFHLFTFECTTVLLLTCKHLFVLQKIKPEGSDTSNFINISLFKINKNTNKTTESWFIAEFTLTQLECVEQIHTGNIIISPLLWTTMSSVSPKFTFIVCPLIQSICT